MATLHRERTIRSRCTQIVRKYEPLLAYVTTHPEKISAATHNAIITAQTEMETCAATFTALAALAHD
jgi:hypothetical protein